MRQIANVVIALTLVVGVEAVPDECDYGNRPLLDLIRQYADDSGAQFVLDPRITASSEQIGVAGDVSIDSGFLVELFQSLRFNAYESDGVIYVIPQAGSETIASELGAPWEG